MTKSKQAEELSLERLNSDYHRFLADYQVRGTSVEAKQHLASEIEKVLIQAIENGYVAAARQLANIYAGQALYPHGLDVWPGLYRIPEIADSGKAVARIENHDSRPEWRVQKYLAAVYVSNDPEKLDRLTYDGKLARDILDLGDCFTRAKQIHDGNPKKNISTSLKALAYLEPLFNTMSAISRSDDTLHLRCNAVDLLLDIADRHGVLRAAFSRAGTYCQGAGKLMTSELHEIVVDQVGTSGVGQSPAVQVA